MNRDQGIEKKVLVLSCNQWARAENGSTNQTSGYLEVSGRVGIRNDLRMDVYERERHAEHKARPWTSELTIFCCSLGSYCSLTYIWHFTYSQATFFNVLLNFYFSNTENCTNYLCLQVEHNHINITQCP